LLVNLFLCRLYLQFFDAFIACNLLVLKIFIRQTKIQPYYYIYTNIDFYVEFKFKSRLFRYLLTANDPFCFVDD